MRERIQPEPDYTLQILYDKPECTLTVKPPFTEEHEGWVKSSPASAKLANELAETGVYTRQPGKSLGAIPVLAAMSADAATLERVLVQTAHGRGQELRVVIKHDPRIIARANETMKAIYAKLGGKEDEADEEE